MPGKTQKTVTLRKSIVEQVELEIKKEHLKNLYGSVASFIEDAIRHHIIEIKKTELKKNKTLKK